MSEDDGFLSRWVRRKAQAKAGVVTEGEPAPVVAPTPLPTAAEASVEIPAEQQSPPLTMDDVAALTRESDFSRFIAPEVDESIQRAAMKKLFADPHFNVMDGLDTYIADYGKPDPIPPSMLRRMAQSQMLGLFDSVHPEVSKDEERPSPEPKASTDGAAPPAMPQSAEPHPAVPPDEDPDLRLQQDDAAGCGGAGKGSDA